MKDVTLVYKSGLKVHVKVKSMTVRHNDSGITEVTWDTMLPHPLAIGVNDLAAVFEGKL